MAEYKFDGKHLKRGSTIIANVSGGNIRKDNGSTTIANISGHNIRQGSGSTTIFNVSGDTIREGSGSTKVATLRDIQKVIDGVGGTTLMALWAVCVR
jgi:hypothetical protein